MPYRCKIPKKFRLTNWIGLTLFATVAISSRGMASFIGLNLAKLTPGAIVKLIATLKTSLSIRMWDEHIPQNALMTIGIQIDTINSFG